MQVYKFLQSVLARRFGFSGLSGNVTKGRKDVTDRPKVVLEYLEELSLEVLKKRLEESESKYSAMRKKTEDVLVAQKLDIQRLKNEISSKNEVGLRSTCSHTSGSWEKVFNLWVFSRLFVIGNCSRVFVPT